MSILISWSLKIVNFYVLILFVFINAEVIVTFGGNLGESFFTNSWLLLSRELILEAHKLDFMFDQFVDLVLDLRDFTMITGVWLGKSCEVPLPCIEIIKSIKVISLGSMELLILFLTNSWYVCLRVSYRTRWFSVSISNFVTEVCHFLLQ